MTQPSNKKRLIQTAGALLIISVASTSFAACKRPAEPSLPDAELADHQEIQKASTDVNQYLKNINRYLRCEKSGSRQTIAQRKMRKVVKNYNAMIEEYKVILAEYNNNKTAIVTASISN